MCLLEWDRLIKKFRQKLKNIKMDKNLKSVVAELKKASRMHAAQAKKIERHIKAMQKGNVRKNK